LIASIGVINNPLKFDVINFIRSSNSGYHYNAEGRLTNILISLYTNTNSSFIPNDFFVSYYAIRDDEIFISSYNICAYFTGNIVIGINTITEANSSYIYIISDKRVKFNIENIDENKSLDIISKIEPKTFNFIDYHNKGFKKNYGFIAQDVKELIPEIITYRKDFIPNVYNVFHIKDDVIETIDDFSSILNVNDTIQIMDMNNKTDYYNILDISSNYIKIDKKIEGDKCFIFGKLVDDFHILDYNSIFTFNVSATQELYELYKKQEEILKTQEEILMEQERKFEEQEKQIKYLLNINEFS